MRTCQWMCCEMGRQPVAASHAGTWAPPSRGRPHGSSRCGKCESRRRGRAEAVAQSQQHYLPILASMLRTWECVHDRGKRSTLADKTKPNEEEQGERALTRNFRVMFTNQFRWWCLVGGRHEASVHGWSAHAPPWRAALPLWQHDNRGRRT